MNRYSFDNTDDKHMHLLDGKPLMGTSTIVGVLAKPLTWWASGLAVAKLGWTKIQEKVGKKYIKNPRSERLAIASQKFAEIKQKTDDEYLDLLDEAYSAHSKNLKETASDGTDLHQELENYIKAHMTGITITPNPRIEPFIKWTNANVKRFIWSEKHCYSEKLWTGGISDCGVELINGDYGILDFKRAKDAYTSMFIQCAGYDTAIEENGLFEADGTFIMRLDKPIKFYGIIPFGADVVGLHVRYDTEDLKKAFEACTLLHKLTNLD